MQPFYLYSHSNIGMAGDELTAISEVLGEQRMSDLITDIPAGSLVVPRFRAIPFGQELEREIAALGSKTVNTFQQHRHIADLFSWVNLLNGLTPPAYTLEDIPHLEEGEYFIKGETNSIKNRWFDAAYAPCKKDVIRIVHNLLQDQYVGHQKVAIRPFQHYRQLGLAVDDRPVFHERRAFFLDGQLLSDAFYWSSFSEEFGDTQPLNPQEYEKTLAHAIAQVQHLARFIVIDLAEYPDGTWGVVELNDGCMSGLSDNDPATLWSNFIKVAAGSS